MERMIIKHISGSKSNQVEEFPLHHYNELILGRDAASTVQYDPDRDDLVGRQHAKISRDPNDPNSFLLEDLKSRNGTFLNKQRLTGVSRLQPGDSVQLGPNGPEFTFDIEPRLAGMTKATRIADAAIYGKVSPETRIADSDGGNVPPSVITAPTGKASVGKATVERMISHTVSETKKTEGKKYATIGVAAGAVVLLLFGVVVGGGYWYNAKQKAETQAQLQRQEEESRLRAAQSQKESDQLKSQIEKDKAAAPRAAAEIAEKNGKSVVYIQGSWQLTNQVGKTQLYHQFIPNDKATLGEIFKENFGKGPIVENAPSMLPVYIQTSDGGHEPYLTDKKSEYSQPIGGSGSCSGVIVTTDGYILTNKHCSAPWKAPYSFPQNYPPGVLIGTDGNIVGLVEAPRNWIPENTKSGPRQFRGSYDATWKITVTLPGTDNPIEAQRIQDNPRHDVGMLKISVPGNLPKAELNDNYDTIKKGESLVIMGYPGTAPRVYKAIVSQNPMDQETKYVEIPDPTVTVTSVGNIVRNSSPNDMNNVRVSIDAKDSIRYAGGLTYGGNSGGPVFDMQGKVIGLHYLGDGGGGAAGNISGMAVPIRYGIELFPGGNSQ